MSFFWFLFGIFWLLEEQVRDLFKGEATEDGWTEVQGRPKRAVLSAERG